MPIRSDDPSPISCGPNILDIQETAKYTPRHKKEVLINGDLFWLYVVEYAEKDEFKMYRIQNPPLKANHFMFDDGWRSFAEDTEHGNIQNDEDSKTDEN